MLILHGLIWSRDAERAAALIGDAAEIRRSGRLGLVVGQIAPEATATPAGASAFALTHNTLLSRLAAEIDLLPARLGDGAPTARALRSRIAARRPQLLAALQRLTGAAEYSVSFEAAATGRDGAGVRPAEAATGARGYLRRKLAVRRARDAADAERRRLFAGAAQILEKAALESRVMLGPSPARPQRRLALSLLIERSREAELAALADPFAAQAPALGLRMDIVGPWPAYSFVGAAEEEAA